MSINESNVNNNHFIMKMPNSSQKSLTGRVCLVTGATRGIGKGIALQLGEAGATVYITGRTLKSVGGSVGGSLNETANEIEKRGGKCVAVQCDHSSDKETQALFERISSEQNGQLDVLVNSAYAGVQMIIDYMNKKFYESDPVAMWDTINGVGLRNYYLCSTYAARLMAPRKSGLIINIESLGGLTYFYNAAYGIGKAAGDRMVADCGEELRSDNIAYISLWPGIIKTEIIKNAVDVSTMPNDYLHNSTTPEYVGKVAVQLCRESNKQLMERSGRIFFVDDIADSYGIKDIDGTRPLNLRSVQFILEFRGYKKLAKWVPSCVKVPLWVLGLQGKKF